MSASQAVDRFIPPARALAGGTRAEITTLTGDASNRRYHRIQIHGGNPSSLIVMELAAEPLRSEEGSSAGPPQELPFINIHRYLERVGAAVPKIYQAAVAQGFLLLEDLGDTTLESAVRSSTPVDLVAHYRRAIDTLIALQSATRLPDPNCLAFSRVFDQDLLLWELHHFREWLLEADRDVRLDPARAAELDRFFQQIAAELANQPRRFVHRDFQSRNLMLQDSRLRIIDFQDALQGTVIYDLVALLRDSYVQLPPAALDELFAYYARATAAPRPNDLRRLFDLQTVQRKLKDAGRFVYIDRVKRNPSFLRWIPSSLGYVRTALDRLPELDGLRGLLSAGVPELG
jgi:aminoglycoside/choline kinase family phosphotransferase